MKKYLLTGLLPCFLLNVALVAQSTDDFRTFQSGSWSDVNTWERFDGTSWINPAPVAPTSTVGVITVLNTHTVSVTADVSIDQTIVNAGGQISINASVNLTIVNGAGTDLDVSGNILSTGILAFSSSTAVFNSGSFYIHAQGGNTVPSNTFATYSNGSTIKIITATATPMPRLPAVCHHAIWDCPAQTTTNQLFLSNNVSTINGDLTITTTGTGNMKFATSATRTLTIGGNLQIDAGTFNIVTGTGGVVLNVNGNAVMNGGNMNFSSNTGIPDVNISGNLTVNAGTINMSQSSANGTCDVNGNFTLAGGTVNIASSTGTPSVTIVGNVALNSGTLNVTSSASVPIVSVKGNWTNNGGTFNSGTGSNGIILNGSAGSQTIGGTVSTAFNNLTINNTFGTSPQIVLARNTTVNNQLTMTQGNVNLAGFVFTLGVSAVAPGTLSHNGTSANGWMYGGTFTRWIATPAIAIPATAGLLPIGSASDYCPMWIGSGANLTSGGTVSVNFTYIIDNTEIVFTDASWGRDVEAVTNSYWTLSSTLVPSGSNMSVRFGGGILTFGANNLDSIAAELASSSVGDWSVSTANAVANEVNRIGLSSANFNQQWHIATSRILSANLPISWLEFEPVHKGNRNIQVNWSTATESNNDYFKVLRSQNGIEFSEVARYYAKGNSLVKKEYKVMDRVEESGLWYYRVTQHDLNGDSSSTPVRSVSINEIPTITFYPNPVSEELTVGGMPGEWTDISVEITDAMGRIIKMHAVAEDEAALIRLSVFDLAPGIYFVNLVNQTNEKLYLSQKVIKN